MIGLVPDPPPSDSADWPALVGAYLATGVYGGCVMCPDGGYTWFDLTLADLPPVVDRTGTLTDQVPLHPRCIRALVEHWRMILGLSDSGPGDAAEAPDSLPGAGVRPTQPIEWSRPARARVGAYARRGGVT